jgi:hypothetical protein
VLSQEAGQSLQGPEVAHNETYLQEAGVLSQEAGQSLQGPEVAHNETYLQEDGVLRQEAGQSLQGPEVVRTGGYKFLGEEGCQILGHSAIHSRVNVSLQKANSQI